MKKGEIKGRREKRQKKNFKKQPIILVVLLVLILISSIVLLLIIKNNKELIKKMKSHYGTNVVMIKKAKLYDKNQKEIGVVSKGFTFSLRKRKIDNPKKQYFQIENSDYYLYYEDFNKTTKTEQDTINAHYLVFNKNIKTKKETTFFKDNKKVLTLKDGVNLQILYTDDKYYYVSYLGKVLQLKKGAKDELVDQENTKESESSYISVIHYEKIEETCKDISCVSNNNVKEQLGYLKENGYYSITMDDYNRYLAGQIRLKEKAVLLTTGNQNDFVNQLNQEYELNIQLVDNNTNLKFNSTNKKSTRESNKESIDRYQIKSITTLDNFKKMVAGEEVVEKIPISKSSTEQSIPVLNYHFFYDSSLGEGCSENICLDVKKFREQLNYLKENGYKTLKMSEFRKWMYGEIDLPEKSVLLTVDDGAAGTGKHNGNKLIPILEEYGMNATLFLISGWWDRENYRSPNLDVQSHTFDMHNYGNCGKGQVVCASHDELLEDLKKSLTIVDNSDSFCFPFYQYSDLSVQTVQEAGFKLAFIGGNRKAKRSDNKFLVPRYPIYNTTSLSTFINMVS